MNQGIESYFNNVISTKVVPLSELSEYSNDLLHITEDDEDLGIKYVYQTRKTPNTVNERIRGPLRFWKKNETYIDNNLQQVLDRLRDYYG
jgi:hypothetical protein